MLRAQSSDSVVHVVTVHEHACTGRSLHAAAANQHGERLHGRVIQGVYCCDQNTMIKLAGGVGCSLQLSSHTLHHRGNAGYELGASWGQEPK